VSIETEEELEALQAAGRVVAESLAAMRSAVHPGTTTAELDAVAAHVFRRAGARSGPQPERAAHVEHTVVIGRERPVVLTRIP